jgi:hypothetical protein
MKLRINILWNRRNKSRENVNRAEREVRLSRQRYDDAVHNTLKPLHALREENHFAELLAGSLAEGYNRK